MTFRIITIIVVNNIIYYITQALYHQIDVIISRRWSLEISNRQSFYAVRMQTTMQGIDWWIEVPKKWCLNCFAFVLEQTFVIGRFEWFNCAIIRRLALGRLRLNKAVNNGGFGN